MGLKQRLEILRRIFFHNGFFQCHDQIDPFCSSIKGVALVVVCEKINLFTSKRTN